MEPFKNNNFVNKNTKFFGYTNPTQVIKQEYSYTANNDVNLESYFNQPYTENTNNSYDINYLPIANEINNNYSYTFPETINSKNNNNYSNYIEPSNSKEYISNTYYNNNSRNIKSTKNTITKSHFSNFATVKPLQVSIKEKSENINYNYHYNNNEPLNPSKNVNYYTDDTANYYKEINTTNLESNLISSTTNNLNNINLNEKYTNNVIINNSSSINDNFNYVPFLKIQIIYHMINIYQIIKLLIIILL